jgi:flagellar FliL protein
MSAAAAPVASVGDAPEGPRKGRKKLVALIGVLALVLSGAGGGALWLVKKRHAAEAAAAAEADADGDAAAATAQQRDVRKTPPAFLPMENFIVNLADKDSERFAQIGITLELDDARYADPLKAYMPAIRNGVLMVIAHKTSQELLTRAGKEKLAMEVMRESVRPLGIELEDENEPARPGNRRTPLEESPVRHVHFSSFIIQ